MSNCGGFFTHGYSHVYSPNPQVLYSNKKSLDWDCYLGISKIIKTMSTLDLVRLLNYVFKPTETLKKNRFIVWWFPWSPVSFTNIDLRVQYSINFTQPSGAQPIVWPLTYSVLPLFTFHCLYSLPRFPAIKCKVSLKCENMKSSSIISL